MVTLHTLGAIPLSTHLSRTSKQLLMGKDARIGQLIEPMADSLEAYTVKALGTAYSLAWVETYVAQDMQYALVRTFDQELSAILPQHNVLVGRATKHGDTFVVPFRYGSQPSYGSFVWVELPNGGYSLVSLSLERQ